MTARSILAMQIGCLRDLHAQQFRGPPRQWHITILLSLAITNEDLAQLEIDVFDAESRCESTMGSLREPFDGLEVSRTCQ